MSTLPAAVTYWNETAQKLLVGKPTVFRPPAWLPPLISEEETFETICESSQTKNPQAQEPLLHWFIGDGELITRHARWRPRRSDASLPAYLKRVRPQLNRQDLGLLIDSFQTVMPPAARARLMDVLRGFYDFTGIPGNGAGVTFFAGCYRKTPFGAHLDPADHILHFVIHGRKRMRLWRTLGSRARLAPDDALKDYEKHLSQSVVLEGKPGDVIYWTPEYWHVGETDGEPSAAVSLALNYGGDPGALLERRFANAIRQVRLNPGTVFSLPDSGPAVHRAFDKARRRFEVDLKRIDLERETWIATLNLVTNYGLRGLIPLQKAPALRGSTRVQRVSGTRVLHAKTAREEIVSANGRSHVMPLDAAVEGVVKELSGDTPLRVDELIGRGPRRGARLELLQALARFGALECSKTGRNEYAG